MKKQQLKTSVYMIFLKVFIEKKQKAKTYSSSGNKPYLGREIESNKLEGEIGIKMGSNVTVEKLRQMLACLVSAVRDDI